MNATVIGSQFGDEGKGRAVDLFGDIADVVIRYQGGDNAGHTVIAGDEEYKLRLVPSGVVRGATGVLGNGCVINLGTLFEEIERLRERGLNPDVRVSNAAHVVFPYHQMLDRAEETVKAEEESAVGTTGNGIGPAYEDRAGRRGVRIGELSNPDRLRERLEYTVASKRHEASALNADAGTAFDVDQLVATFAEYGDRLAAEGMVIDAGRFLTERARDGDALLFEGAQGTGIDLDHGNYPFVTSSNPTAGGAIAGAGVSPSTVADGAIVGVVKAYLTRVGSGAMPTEFDTATTESLREDLSEFGTVTGRPRRIGWLDLPMLRRAARVNGYTSLVVNHIDALADFDEIQLCTAYNLNGDRLVEPPGTTAAWACCEPVYESFEPWMDQDWATIADRGYSALPAAAQTYLEAITDALGVPIAAVGVGPARDQTIVCHHPLLDEGDDSSTES